MICGTENSIQLARFRAVALAEDTLLCKAKQQRSRWSSANAEANVADCFEPKRCFNFRRPVPSEPCHARARVAAVIEAVDATLTL
jgi:hypothetical protein